MENEIASPNRYNEDMEQETPRPIAKLIDVIQSDFADVSNVRVSFPENWEYVDRIETERSLLYIAGFPIERSFTGRDHFHGLGSEVNVNLVFYRLYKFFQPWPIPQVSIEWNAKREQGRVTDIRDKTMQLQPVGQAQVWFGAENAVLWECYLEGNWAGVSSRNTLEKVWRGVERDISARKLYTLPHEPAFAGNYRDFLRSIGYEQDSEYSEWWSKKSEPRRLSISPESRTR